MKNLLIILLTIVCTFLHSSEKSMVLTQKTLSPSELADAENTKLKDTFGGDYHLTLVSLENIPEGEKVNFTIKRPLLKKTKFPDIQSRDFSMTDLQKSLEEIPFFVIQGLGYFPGEEVQLFFAVDGSKSNTLSIIPYPIKSTSTVDNASVSVRFASIEIGQYFLTLDNFKPNEEIEFISESFNEVISNKIVLKSKISIGTMPAVKGKKGGNNKISIKRSNGETMTLVIPWGDVAKKLSGLALK